MFKKSVLSNFASAFLLAGALTAGAAQAQEPAKPELKVGLAPELQKKGYRIRYVEFSTGLEANNAVFKSEIDANVMQHTIFLNSYNERQKTDLVGIVHVPTPPMGLYSKKHPPGTPIKPGSTVAVPNDPVDLQRVETHQRFCAGEDDDSLHQCGGGETRQCRSLMGAGYCRRLQVADVQD